MNLTYSLGWTLIHFLWQGAAIAVVLAGVLALLRHAGPRTRYAASCAAMILMLVCGTATLLIMEFTHGTLPARSQPVVSAAADSGIFLNADRWSERPVAPAVGDYLPFLVWAWFGGVFALSIRSLGGWAVAARFARKYTTPAAAVWQERFADMAKRLRISKPVRLAVSALAQVPAVVGWTKPIVLMPAAVFTGLTAEQVEALLAHELAHVCRHDYLVNLMQTAVETLLFYHPAVWWVGRSIRNERENCCDDLAIEICGNRVAYVRALTELEQMRGVTPRLAMAADGGSLLQRVQRLLRMSHSGNSAPSGLLLIVGIAVISLSVAGVAAKELRQEPAAAPERPAPAPPVDPLAPPAPQATPAPRPAPARGGTRSVDLITPQRADNAQTQSSGDWLGEIESAGFRDLTVDKLIEMKVQGITGDYIREIRAAGFDPDADKLIEMRVHGVTGDYAQQIRSTGLQTSLDKLLEFRIHGIDADWINAQNRAGFGNLSADKLIELRIHGVSSDFVSQIRSLGYPDISVDTILEMRIHGITPDYVREAKSRFKDLTPDQIIQLKTYNILK
jgi:beta-lactamase regulating signal transducer with metallopeptidase domain